MIPDLTQDSFSYQPFYQSIVDSWHPHRPFGYDLMAHLKPKTLVELGVHYGDSYFTFCQARKEKNLQTICYGVDHWKGDSQAGEYGEEIYQRVSEINAESYASFSYLLRMSFVQASKQFSDDSIDLLHIDGFHSYSAVSEDLETWLPKVRPAGVILLHDIAVRQNGFGVWKLWEKLKNQFPHFSFKSGYGLGIIQIGTKPNNVIKIGKLILDSKQPENIRKSYEIAHELSYLREQLKGNKSRRREDLLISLHLKSQDAYDNNEKLEEHASKLKHKINELELSLKQSEEKRIALKLKTPHSASVKKKCGSKIPNVMGKLLAYTFCENNLSEKLHWETPKSPLSTSLGIGVLKGTIHIKQNQRIKGVFVRLGVRTIACYLDLRVEVSESSSTFHRFPFHCEFKTGSGFKMCHLFVVFEDGSSKKLGSRLLLARKSNRVPFKSLENPMLAYKAYDPYQSWLALNKSSANHLRYWVNLDSETKSKPLYSFIMPVYNSSLPFLQETILSIMEQTYENWELCITDDGSDDSQVIEYLQRLQSRDNRVKFFRRMENGGIALATNDAIALSKGAYLVFVDHDDLVEPTALSEINAYLEKNPKTDFLYTDDDKIDVSGKRYAPQFKPDWSPELLLSYCYVSHMKIARAVTSAKIGHMREGFEGSQDYDYVLRLSEVCREIGHLPRILYHWRALPGSTATSGAAKPNAFDAGLRAVQDACGRQTIPGEVRQPIWAKKENLGIYEMRFPDNGPAVTILIPTRNNSKLLSKCLKSLKNTSYRNFTIKILDNDSDDPDTLAFLAKSGLEVIKIERPDGKFNFSHIVNRGVEKVETPYLLLLNDDTEVIKPRWLSQMVGLMGMEGVGTVGAKLLFPDGAIQHAGIIHGAGEGYAGPAFRGMNRNEGGYLNYLRSPRNYSAVTAACLLTTKKVYQEIGGFNEFEFAVAYNDVDFGYRVLESGRRCVYCPDAELFHHEGSSRDNVDNPRELANFLLKYRDFRDRYYNPNLSLDNERFEIKPRRMPLQGQSVPRVLAVTHNLNREGAPICLFELMCALEAKGSVHLLVVSLAEGSMRDDYEKAGINVKTVPFSAKGLSIKQYEEKLSSWMERIRIHDYDLIYANTLDTHFAIDAARNANRPSIWNIHESISPPELFKNLEPDVAQKAYECFEFPYRLIFVCKATANLYQPFTRKNNFSIIHNALNPVRYETGDINDQHSKLLNLPENENVILCVGTICSRKGQLDLIKAFESLPEGLKSCSSVVLVGDAPGRYADTVVKYINSNPCLQKKIILTGAIEHPQWWYTRASVYVCSSNNESCPVTILEAMYFKLPIVTTPVFGIPEQVMENINATFYQPGQVDELTESLGDILSNKELHQSMSSASLDVLNARGGFKNMLGYYETIIEECFASY
jgi:glycosyltransferase involved in cell wall biosynthesis